MRIYCLTTLFVCLLLGGCASAPRPLYYWGAYEQCLYLSYSKPEKMPPSVLVQKLQEDVVKAAAAGLKVNPGLHAELGLALLEEGQADKALKEFETEKALFPESAPFMDRMIIKLKGGVSQ